MGLEVAKGENPKNSYHKKDFSFSCILGGRIFGVAGVNYAYCGNQFAVYVNLVIVWCTSHFPGAVCQLHLKTKAERKN